MLTLYGLINNNLTKINEQSSIKPIWIDCSGIKPEHLRDLEANHGIIEAFDVEVGYLKKLMMSTKPTWAVIHNDKVYAKIILGTSSAKTVQSVYIVLTKKMIFSFRERSSVIYDPKSDERYDVQSPVDALISVLVEMLEQASVILTNLAGISDELSCKLFHQNKEKHLQNSLLTQMISSIGKTSQYVMKIQQSLESITFLCDFLGKESVLNFLIPEKRIQSHIERFTSLHTEIDSLQNLAGFIIQNLAYLSDAAIGMIGVNQNTLMMYLSILATVFIPPSLIVSIFSVQFEGMPSFHWTTGFLVLFLLMSLSSFGAYKILKSHQETLSS